jgi:GntR family transcriptional regulator, N-acetylglucosamine utilization regulator
MNNLSRQSKLPLYQQLYDILRGELTRGQWKPGELLPAESELMQRFEVSRITVRQVLDMLVRDGLIYRQQGRGTFVAHPTIEQTQVRIVSFTEDMHQRGFRPGTEVLEAGLIPAPADIAARLAVEPGEELAHLRRLRTADDEPMSIEDAYLVHHYFPGVLSGDYTTSPLRRTLEEKYGVRLVRAKQVLRAVMAPRDLARLLSVRQGAALLFIERVSFSAQSVPVEFLRIHYRGDRYVLYNELAG